MEIGNVGDPTFLFLLRYHSSELSLLRNLFIFRLYVFY